METLNILREAFQSVDPATRAIFAAGYLEDKKLLPCSMDRYVEAADKFMSDTGVSAEDWETFVSVLVYNAISKNPGGIVDYRKYIGDAAAAYTASMNAGKEQQAAVQVGEYQANIPLDQTQYNLVNSFSNMLARFPSLPDEADMFRRDVTLDKVNLVGSVVARNSDNGPVFIAFVEDRAAQFGNRILGESKPTKKGFDKHVVRLPGMTYTIMLTDELGRMFPQ